ARHRPARYCCPVGCLGHLEIINASDVLDNPNGPRGKRSRSWSSWTSPTRLVLARWYLYPMLLRRVAFPDFCEPCLPSFQRQRLIVNDILRGKRVICTATSRIW